MRVTVVMSTYEGKRFVREQIASILSQLPPQGRLLVRDDGSKDGTADAVASIGDARISLERGENVGFARSFFRLLAATPEDSEMVMLSDQDDVWLPGKIQRAWDALQAAGDTPALYCARLQLVDDQLRPVGLSPAWGRPPSFDNAITENIVTGCTSALNPAALKLVRDPGDVSLIHFHDWWFYLVVTAFGRVIHDPEPAILYRQHGGNAVGMGSGVARYLAILRFLRRHDWVHIMFRQLHNFRCVHGARLAPAQAALLDRYFNPHDARSAARLVVTPRRFRQSLVGEALFRLLLLANIVSGRGLMPVPYHDSTP